MERVKVDAYVREKTGKETAKKVRKQGNIPAVVYGQGENLAVSISPVGFKALKAVHFAEGAVIDMKVTDGKTEKTIPVLIKDIQFDPISEKFRHFDFLKVSMKEKIKVHVYLEIKGEAAGVQEGGVLDQILREVEVEGLPLNIPEKIEVDVSSLGIGDSLHVGALQVSEDVEIVTDPEETVVTVVAPEEEEAPAEEPAAEEEAQMEQQEPEVIKEKKDKEEETSQ